MSGSQERKKKRSIWDLLLPVLLVVFVTIGVLGGVKLLQDKQERQEGNGAYASLADAVVFVQEPEVLTEEPGQEQASEEQQEAPLTQQVKRGSIQVDFAALQALNEQIVAWIRTSDGTLNYPVVRGTDNEYYLNHLVDGRVNRNGSIFMDFRNEPDLSDQNTFLYGHNMLDGTMFASLSRYSTAGYYEEHPELQLLTPEGNYVLQVFAGCVVPGNSDLYQISFRDEAEFGTYLERVRALSEFSTEVEVAPEDRIVTLSTCAYNYEDARYVLFCKLAEE